MVISFMMLAMIALTSTGPTTQARSLSGDDGFSNGNCPTDNIPSHVGANIKSHSSNGYAHFMRGTDNPPGC